MNEPTVPKEDLESDAEAPGNDLEKSRELYVFAKEAYADLTERIRRTEDKSAKLMALCGSLVAFGGLVGLFILDSFVPPRTAFDWASLICFVLFIVGVIAAFFSLLGTVNLTNRLRSPLNDKMVAYFKAASLPKIHCDLAEEIKKALAHNDKEHEKKIRRFKFGYWTIFFSLVVIAIFVASRIVKTFMTHNCGG